MERHLPFPPHLSPFLSFGRPADRRQPARICRPARLGCDFSQNDSALHRLPSARAGPTRSRRAACAAPGRRPSLPDGSNAFSTAASRPAPPTPVRRMTPAAVFAARLELAVPRCDSPKPPQSQLSSAPDSTLVFRGCGDQVRHDGLVTPFRSPPPRTASSRAAGFLACERSARLRPVSSASASLLPGRPSPRPRTPPHWILSCCSACLPIASRLLTLAPSAQPPAPHHRQHPIPAGSLPSPAAHHRHLLTTGRLFATSDSPSSATPHDRRRDRQLPKSLRFAPTAAIPRPPASDRRHLPNTAHFRALGAPDSPAGLLEAATPPHLRAPAPQTLSSTTEELPAVGRSPHQGAVSGIDGRHLPGRTARRERPRNGDAVRPGLSVSQDPPGCPEDLLSFPTEARAPAAPTAHDRRGREPRCERWDRLDGRRPESLPFGPLGGRGAQPACHPATSRFRPRARAEEAPPKTVQGIPLTRQPRSPEGLAPSHRFRGETWARPLHSLRPATSSAQGRFRGVRQSGASRPPAVVQRHSTRRPGAANCPQERERGARLPPARRWDDSFPAPPRWNPGAVTTACAIGEAARSARSTECAGVERRVGADPCVACPTNPIPGSRDLLFPRAPPPRSRPRVPTNVEATSCSASSPGNLEPRRAPRRPVSPAARQLPRLARQDRRHG